MRHLLAATAVLGILGTFSACGASSTTPSATESFEMDADQVAFQVRQTLTNDGVRTAILNSDTAYIYERERRLDLVGVEVLFFNEIGEEAGTLTSRTGDYNIDSGAFIARGDVVLVTRSPAGQRRLETEELLYDVRADSLASDTPFTLHEDGRVSRGTSFRSDSRFRTWIVTGAQTQGSVPAEGGITF